MNLLERAVIVAVQAHQGQKDKGGHPYILHPLRAMMSLSGKGEDAQIAAVLHDVVEDTQTTLEDLKAFGFSRPVISAVDALTRRQGESYSDFILRAKANPIARVVKVKDLEDNLDLSRLISVTEEDLARAEKYRQNLLVLQTD